MKTLRILCTAVSAVCIAAFLPVGTIFGWGYAAICAAGAFCFFSLMLLFKQSQPRDSSHKNDSEGSFFAPSEKNQADADQNAVNASEQKTENLHEKK